MANSVDLVIGSEAIKQVENLISKLSLADAEILKISQSAITASKSLTGISTPSGQEKLVNNTSALNAELERQNKIITDLTKKLDALLKKHEDEDNSAKKRLKTLEQETKNRQALQAQKEKAIKQAEKEAAIAAKNASIYNKTQTQINNLTKAYNDLAVRKERYNNLTVNEEMRLKTLSAVNEKYNGILKATDATIGKNQRNVGNYASGYNALGNSINQLSREAPAFANSVNTGFMALSNNFPALFDAINGIRDKNKILVAEGKPTVSVLKSIAGAVFSWQSLLSVGVTLLTIYGAKLIDYAFNTDEAKKAVDSLNKAYERNDELLKISANNIDHQITLQKELMRQQGASQKELNSLDEEGSKLKLSNAEKIRDSYQKQINEVNKYKDAVKKGNGEAYFDELLKSVGRGNIAKEQSRIRRNADDEVLAVLLNNLTKAENEVKAAGFRLSELSAGNKTKEIEENKKLSSETLKLEEDRLKTIAELRKKELELQLANIDQKVNNEDLYFTDRLTALDADFLKRIEIAKVDYDEEFRLSKGSQEKQKIALINFQLEKLKIIDDYNKKKNTLEQLDLDPITKLATSKDKVKNPFQSVIDSAKNATKNLHSQTETIKSDWKETFNSIAENAQKAGDIIAEFSQRNFENEYRRLDAQKDISLKFAGDSAAAKQKIEEDYEKKHKEIANRENKAKQKQAIFNIAIDTAQAIIATLAKTPPPEGLPLAFVMGALGAAQIALVASQKIPQYFDGTDNHIGGMMLVNDGAGANYQEKVILPNGKEIMPEGRNVLMNAPKGTKVLTHEQQIMQMLNERGISMSAKYSQNNGMTANEMDGIMSKHFAKIQTNTTTIDKRGFSQWTERNGNRTIQNNNRVSRTGFNV